jgi:hypothetical protein
MRVSYLEIYKEEIRDLFLKPKEKQKRLKLRERTDVGVYV